MAAMLVTCLSVISFITGLSAYNDHLNNVLFSGQYEFIDLAYPFDNKTVYWPGTQHFIFTKKLEQDQDYWYASNEFAAGEHGGTHIDAPYHFNKSGKQVGEIPLESLIVPLVIVDISSKVNDDSNFVLYKHDLDYILYDYMGKPCLIIFKFGWSKHFYNVKKYLGMDEERNTLNFPGLSAEVAEWITYAYKNVVGIGVDVASVDPGSSKNYPVHQIIAKAGLYNLENINLYRNIPEHGCTALILPMKIATGTGAPVRVVAICPTNK